MPLGANKAGLFGAAGASAGFDTGLFFGGNTGSGLQNVIQYITISTTGDAADFGDLQRSKEDTGVASNGNSDRGVIGGGTIGSDVELDEIGYVTISSAGNATDFGNLATARNTPRAASNGSTDRCVFGGGSSDPSAGVDEMDYITISSTGNSSDFGDLTQGRRRLGALSNATGDRGVWGGGIVGSNYDIMDYVTISSTGDAADFGDLTSAGKDLAGLSNGTNNRGLWGAQNKTNVISYITISSTGDAADFGDLTIVRSHPGGLSNGTNERGVFGGGLNGGKSDVMEYITISSTGNATDFGDLLAETSSAGATSNS